MKTKTRTLALEIRMSRVGFAVLEGPSRLLDWGVRGWYAGADPAISVMGHLAPLLSLYSPVVVVLRDMSHSSRTDRKRIIMAVRRRLLKCSVDVHMVKRADVRKAFLASGSENKYQIADAIAAMFPELRWKLPMKYKFWHGELRRVALFDAVSLALTDLSRRGLPPESRAEEAA